METYGCRFIQDLKDIAVQIDSGGLEMNTKKITQEYCMNRWTEIIRECSAAAKQSHHGVQIITSIPKVIITG